MKGRFFDKGTFKEAFVQLKVAGILFSVMGALISIIYTVGRIVDRIEYRELVRDVAEAIEDYYIPATEEFPVEFFYLLYAVAFVALPMMVLMIFSFLTRRNACDFYHSVPVKRSAMYGSIVAAIMAWTMIIYVSSCVFAMVITGFDSGMTMDMLEAWKIIGETFVACIFIAGTFCLGCALTGTGITNSSVSLMILLGPRIIITIIQTILEELVPYSEMSYGSWLLNNSYNIVFRLLEELESQVTVGMVPTLIYSTVVGIIYMAIGGFVFVKRKSETAAQATAHPTIQTVCKMVPSFMCALIAVWGTLEIIINGRGGASEYFAIIVLMIISVGIYLVYDVVTNRKAKSFVKSVKQLPIFFGIVVLAGVILGAVAVYERNWEPETEDVEGIELFALDYIYSYLGIEKLDIEDNEELNEIVVNAYKRQLEKRDESEEEYYYNGDYYVYAGDYYDEEMVVGIDTGMTTRYRRVRFTAKEIATILAISTKHVMDEGYKINLPKYSGNIGIYATNIDMSSDDDKKLYDCLRNEVSKKGISEIMTVDKSSVIVTLRVYVDSYDGSERTLDIPVGDNIPETKKFIMESAYRYAKSSDEKDPYYDGTVNYGAFEKWVKANSEKEEQDEKFSLVYVGTNASVEEARYQYVSDVMSEEEYVKLFDILDEIVTQEASVSKDAPILYMHLELPSKYFKREDPEYYVDDGELYTTVVAYRVSEENAKALMEHMGTLDYMTEEEGYIDYEYYE